MSTQYAQYPVQMMMSQRPPTQQYQPQAPQPPVYLCLYPQCASTGKFARHADLLRHVQVIHNPETLPRIDCQYTGCHRKGNYGFSRKDKMVEHMREVHKVDIPKRAPGRRPSS